MRRLFALPLLSPPDDAGAAVLTRDSPDVPQVGMTMHRSLPAEIVTAPDGQRSTFQIMTGLLARDGMIVEPEGGEFDDYLRNPVVLWQHGYTSERGYLPVGRGANLARTPQGWSADVEWEEDEFSQRLAGMVKRGTVSAVSIGWITLDGGWEERDGRDVYVIRRWKLTEFSVCAVPADAAALVTSRTDTPTDTRQSAEIARLTERVAELEAARAPQAIEEVMEALDGVVANVLAEELAQPVAPRTATPEETEAIAADIARQIHESTLRVLGRA